MAGAFGALVSLAFVRPYDHWYFDLWIGGSVAGLVGFVIGVAWHLADAERRAQTHRPLLLLLGTSAPLVPLFGSMMIPSILSAGHGGVNVPRLTPEAAREEMQALLSGTLTLDGRCLYVTADGGAPRHLVVWPPSVSLTDDADELRLVDAETGVSVPVFYEGGAPVVLGGGEVGDRRPTREALSDPIPSECEGPYWIASGIVEAPAAGR